MNQYKQNIFESHTQELLYKLLRMGKLLGMRTWVHP
jgi:hypothetical protein